MIDIYLHKMTLIEMNVWDPNAELGDLQLMDLASWMNHEDSRATKMRRILANEKKEPLFREMNNQIPRP